MILLFIYFLFVLKFTLISSFNIIGWYVHDGLNIDSSFPPESLNYSIYTHIRAGEPKVFPNGTAICNTNDIITPKIVTLAHKYNVKVQWGLGFSFNPANPNLEIIKNYLDSIGIAANNCNIDGIEVDYEWHNNNWGKIGFIPHRLSNLYSQLLKDIKIALGENKIVSADVTGDVYLLGFNPWFNISMLNNGDFDFVNIMSYYWSHEGSLYQWQKDIELYKNIWKVNPKRVNIGIPYFSINNTFNQPSWKFLNLFCPNIDPNINICNNILFTGKNLNLNIGRLIKKNNFGGAFPWAANYDSLKFNNSLINWLYYGLYN